MRMAVRRLLFVLLFLPVSFALRAQTEIIQNLSALGSGPAPGPRQPYTAQIKVAHVQTLQDGTTITRVFNETVATDSRNRSYTASDSGLPVGPKSTTYRVSDPETGTSMVWRSDKRQVSVLHEPSLDQRHGCWATESGQMRWNFESKPHKASLAETLASSGKLQSREDLGSKTMDGVEATGVRFTMIIPAGAAGNDQPLVIHRENWTAENLHLLLKSVTDDPRSGISTREVSSLKVGDPDPALFQPPSDYEIRTEAIHQVACPE